MDLPEPRLKGRRRGARGEPSCQVFNHSLLARLPGTLHHDLDLVVIQVAAGVLVNQVVALRALDGLPSGGAPGHAVGSARVPARAALRSVPALQLGLGVLQALGAGRAAGASGGPARRAQPDPQDRTLAGRIRILKRRLGSGEEVCEGARDESALVTFVVQVEGRDLTGTVPGDAQRFLHRLEIAGASHSDSVELVPAGDLQDGPGRGRRAGRAAHGRKASASTQKRQ
mmetsp:Transcript_101712/g.303540  ORF Transcript_101712/g.303540 Transcript_101712/m.303540 type:complete len:228 (-) Transcript_101712:81-764(-)